MEEWVSPSFKQQHHEQPSPSPSLTPPSHSQSGVPNPNETRFVALQDKNGTYVVQVPKVQVYRVPPPENALIAERYGNTQKEKKRPCSIFFNKCAIIAIVIVLILAISAALLYVAIRPKVPTFSVDRLVVTNKLHPKYRFTLKAQNPNGHMSISSGKGGVASLFYKRNRIARGDTPELNVKKDDGKNFQIHLTGSNVKLPTQIEKSLSGEGKKTKGKKTKIPLSLTTTIPMKLKLGALKLWTMDIAVDCDMDVNKLSKDTRILHQKCTVKEKK